MKNPAGLIDLVPMAMRRLWADQGLYPNQPVFEMFRDRALLDPDKPAVVTPTDTVTYGQLLDHALRLAASFRAMGMVPGDVIAYQLINTWRCCAIDLAAAAAGVVVAPFPPGRGRVDIESLLRRCDARAVIVPTEFGGIDMCEVIDSLRPTLLSLRFTIVDGAARPDWQQLDALLRAKPAGTEQLPHVCPNAPHRLLVSSGSESEPKLVAYSHNALLGGRGRFLERLHSDGDTFRGMYLVPLGSSFGSTATIGALAWMGGSIALIPKFDAAAAIHAIDKLKPTHIFGVPTMLQRMAADPLLQRVDKSSLKALVCGGAVIDATTIQRCVEAFGCGFLNLYGSADGVNCHNLPGDPVDHVCRTVGRPNPTVCEIQIVDDERRALSDGSVGEIAARGPMSPMQYVNAPELDQRYRDSQGWVYTGDLGYIDADGHLILSGRKKDIIIRGGTNISPVQIEQLVTSHPDVVSAACIGIPDRDLGQRVCLCVTLRDGAARPTLAQLTGYLHERGLEVNKLPEYLRLYGQLPLSPAGKVDKKALTEELAGLADSVVR